MSKEEATAFDEHIHKRIRHGHLPDLRRARSCKWFYNNPWREPYLADMVFGKYFQFAMQFVKGKTLLEVGSGPGHMALEFAREGFEVTGVEISEASVKIARQVNEENTYQDNFGTLKYLIQDFLDWEASDNFDNICFFGTLHHFDKVAEVLDKVRDLLTSQGRIIVVEPARDWLSEKDAAIIALIRWLLASKNSWHENLPLPSTEEEVRKYIDECLREYHDARDHSERGSQSPCDNASFADEMLKELRYRFNEKAFEPGFAFFPRMGGGVRGPSIKEERQMSIFLNLFDHYAVTNGLMNPGGFLWAGQKNK